MVIDSNYLKWYEENIKKISFATGIKEGLFKELEDKRLFGARKYGKESYQISESNSRNVDIKKHAKEEIVDLINYLLHMAVVRKLNEKSALTADLNEMIKYCQSVYELIDEVELEDFD